MRNHIYNKVIKDLSKKRDVKIVGRTILMLSDLVWSKFHGDYVRNKLKRHDIGNKSWGKIDFLMKEYEYKIKHVDSFRR